MYLILSNITFECFLDVAIEQALEGDFRYSHSRVIAHSEEIAFYKGAEREKSIVNSSLQKVQKDLPPFLPTDLDY